MAAETTLDGPPGLPAGKAGIPFSDYLAARKIGASQLALVALLLLVLVIDGVDIQLLSLVAPVILEDWQIGRAAFGPALAGALIGMSLGSLVGGTLGDRLGRRAVLVASVGVFGLATVLAGMTDSIGWMTALRILSGCGFGAAAPNAVALANDWLPVRYRARVTSLMSIGTPAGGMIGASLVLAVLPIWGWRGTFYACGLLTLVVALASFLVVHEAPSYLAAKGKPDAARRNAGKVLGLAETNTLLFNQDTPAEMARAGANFLARRFIRLNLGAGLAFFAVAFVSYALVAWTAIMLTSLGFSMGQALVSVFAFNLAAVVAAVATGFVLGRLGSRTTLAGSSLLLMATLLGLLWLLQMNQGNASLDVLWIVHLLIGCAGGFAGAAMASIYSMMATGYDVECRSGGLGFGMTLGRAGGIVASLIGGLLLDLGDNEAWLFLAILALAAAVAAAAAFISDRHVVPTALLPGAAQ